ncbi:MAG: DUF2937 family protein [Candidatus Woesearchaeota archaeon]
MGKKKNFVIESIDSLANKASAAAGAITTMQAVAFANQYLQSFGGYMVRVKEDIDDNHHRFTEDGYDNLKDEYQGLQEGYSDLQEASNITRPLEVAEHFNYSVAREAVDNFEPTVPLNQGGVAYGLGGLLLGTAAYLAIKRGVHDLFSRK